MYSSMYKHPAKNIILKLTLNPRYNKFNFSSLRLSRVGSSVLPH